MSRRVSRTPFSAWTALAVRIAELMSTSAQVIQHRTHRIAAAGFAPSQRDRREFALMGQEKLIGFGASTAAITASSLAHQRLGARAIAHSFASGAAMLSLLNSRTVSQAVARQIQLAQTIARATTAAERFSNSTAGVSLRVLEPVTCIATANAKRLRRR